MGWHMVITEEMRAMGLSGNDLLVYALIYGFSQRGQGCFYGSLRYISETCGIARRTALYILADLVVRGYITKTETIQNGVRTVTYQVNEGGAETAQGVQNLHRGAQELHQGSAKNAPNNIEDNIDIDTLSNKSRFVKPTLEEVKAYCRERSNQVNPESFFAFYESNGWKVGKNPMKDWKAAVRSWEQRDTERPRTTAPRPQKESVYAHNKRVMEKLFGAQKEVADEQ